MLIDDRKVSAKWDENGIRISQGEYVSDELSAFLPWETVDKRIRELLELGQYIPLVEAESAQAVWDDYVGEKITSLYRDVFENIPNEYKREDVENYVRKSGGKIISRKGCTVYGIGMTSTHIVKTLGGNAETALTVSSLHEGEYGISDVCLSSLSLVNSKGVKSILTQKLSDEEMKKMYESAEALKAVIRGVGL
jgi:hypothetical protein